MHLYLSSSVQSPWTLSAIADIGAWLYPFQLDHSVLLRGTSQSNIVADSSSSPFSEAERIL